MRNSNPPPSYAKPPPPPNPPPCREIGPFGRETEASKRATAEWQAYIRGYSEGLRAGRGA